MHLSFLRAFQVRSRHALVCGVISALAVLACTKEDPDVRVPASGGTSSAAGSTHDSTGGRSDLGGQSSWGGWGGWGGSGDIDEPLGFSFDGSGELKTCAFTGGVQLAPEMPTVAHASFNVSGLKGEVSGAVVEFGLTTNYSMSAPVDLDGVTLRALLIGMKANTLYHYRLAVSNASGHCYSDDKILQTGGLRAGVRELSEKEITGEVAPGFIVAAQGARASIFDRDGDIVWGYTTSNLGGFRAGCSGTGGIRQLFAAKLSFDGNYMLARDLGPFDCGDGGTFYRIALDGSSAETIELPGGDHHDFTVTPRGIAYIAKEQAGGYDQIYTANTDGSNAQLLVDLGPVVAAYPHTGGPGKEKSHVNVIHYWRDRDIYTVSNRESDAVVTVSGDGRILSGIGKAATAPFPTILAQGTVGDVDEPVWRVQHGHDLYEPNKLLVFSNGSFMGGKARALHYTVLENGLATLDWEYTGMGESVTQGDIQMLPNGNVLICASNSGRIHEIDHSRRVVANYKSADSDFGYVMHRSSLYEAPPDGR